MGFMTWPEWPASLRAVPAANPTHYPCAHCGRVLLPAFDGKLIRPHRRPAYVHHVRDVKVVTAFCLLCMCGHYTVAEPEE